MTSVRLILALPAGRSAVMRAASSSSAVTSLGSALKPSAIDSVGGRVRGRPTSLSFDDLPLLRELFPASCIDVFSNVVVT